MIDRKQRKHAEEMLIMARKVDRYRRDVLTAEEHSELVDAAEGLGAFLQKGATGGSDAFEAAVKRLDRALRTTGGKFYPKTFLADNLEVLLVAAIVVLGIRAFFFQPFIIPTNSMYPSYSGMRGVVYAESAEAPRGAARVFRLLTRGARAYDVVAPASGEVVLPLFSFARGSPDLTSDARGIFRYEMVQGRKWFGLLPAVLREYTIFVGGQPVTFRVPTDFSGDQALLETFFPGNEDPRAFYFGMAEAGQFNPQERQPRIATGQRRDAGESVLRFDIELGDALFVDRVSYHFRNPRVGDPFVFRTRTIPLLDPRGNIVDQYYIKRIAGKGGETLRIEDFALLVDGRPRESARAFLMNAAREEGFPGYRNIGNLDTGREYRIPEGHFMALGDNSADSQDSRFFGSVPHHSVIGRAIFIYYPFTRRWGVAE